MYCAQSMRCRLCESKASCLKKWDGTHSAGSVQSPACSTHWSLMLTHLLQLLASLGTSVITYTPAWRLSFDRRLIHNSECEIIWELTHIIVWFCHCSVQMCFRSHAFTVRLTFVMHLMLSCQWHEISCIQDHSCFLELLLPTWCQKINICADIFDGRPTECYTVLHYYNLSAVWLRPNTALL